VPPQLSSIPQRFWQLGAHLGELELRSSLPSATFEALQPICSKTARTNANSPTKPGAVMPMRLRNIAISRYNEDLIARAQHTGTSDSANRRSSRRNQRHTKNNGAGIYLVTIHVSTTNLGGIVRMISLASVACFLRESGYQLGICRGSYLRLPVLGRQNQCSRQSFSEILDCLKIFGANSRWFFSVGTLESGPSWSAAAPLHECHVTSPVGP
jgi:hypothetical protein